MSERYTEAQRRADQLAVNAVLLPLMSATLAEVGLTVAQAMALMEAGQPPPTRGGISATRRKRRADDPVRDTNRPEDQT